MITEIVLFDLPEIGIDRHVGRDIGCQTILEIAADAETRRGGMLCGTIWPISLVEAFFHELFYN